MASLARQGLSRRGFLLGSGAAVVLAACSSDDGSPTVAGPDTSAGGATTTIAPASDLVLGEAFDRNEMLVAGIPQRAPFVVFDRSGGLVRFADAPATIDVTLTLEGGESLAPVTVTRRGEDVERAYYPLAATFPEAGQWQVVADLGAGVRLESLVQVNDDVPIPQVGEPIPVATTPTVADPAGATTICRTARSHARSMTCPSTRPGPKDGRSPCSSRRRRTARSASAVRSSTSSSPRLPTTLTSR